MKKSKSINGVPAIKLLCLVLEVVCPQVGDIYEETFQMTLWKTWDGEYYAFSSTNGIYWNIKKRGIKVLEESFLHEPSGGKAHKKMMRRKRMQKLHPEHLQL